MEIKKNVIPKKLEEAIEADQADGVLELLASGECEVTPNVVDQLINHVYGPQVTRKAMPFLAKEMKKHTKTDNFWDVWGTDNLEVDLLTSAQDVFWIDFVAQKIKRDPKRRDGVLAVLRDYFSELARVEPEPDGSQQNLAQIEQLDAFLKHPYFRSCILKNQLPISFLVTCVVSEDNKKALNLLADEGFFDITLTTSALSAAIRQNKIEIIEQILSHPKTPEPRWGYLYKMAGADVKIEQSMNGIEAFLLHQKRPTMSIQNASDLLRSIFHDFFGLPKTYPKADVFLTRVERLVKKSGVSMVDLYQNIVAQKKEEGKSGALSFVLNIMSDQEVGLVDISNELAQHPRAIQKTIGGAIDQEKGQGRAAKKM